MNCPQCKKKIEDVSDLKSTELCEYGQYLEVRTECTCGQKFYTSLKLDDLLPEE